MKGKFCAIVQLAVLDSGAQGAEAVTWAWESAWDSVNGEFSRVAEVVLACNPNLWWECGHQDNESFPFRAYAAFSRQGTPGGEDVVISFDFKRSDGELAFTSDVSRGDGEVLAAGPSSETQRATDTGRVREWVVRTIEEGLAFVHEQEGLLRRELC